MFLQDWVLPALHLAVQCRNYEWAATELGAASMEDSGVIIGSGRGGSRAAGVDCCTGRFGTQACRQRSSPQWSRPLFGCDHQIGRAHV